jgi:hypothetical protein
MLRAQIQSERSSSYSWIARTGGGVRINEPPFLIRIVGTTSRMIDQNQYHCQHSWAGTYFPDGTVHMGGAEIFIGPGDGHVPGKSPVRFFGPFHFTLKQ